MNKALGSVFLYLQSDFLCRKITLTQPKEAEWLQLYPNLKPVP